MKTRAQRARPTSAGFTTVEVSVVSGLMVLLAVILGATWGAFGRPLMDADTRCRLILEAQMAATALAHDVGGYGATSGGRADGKLVGRLVTSNEQLQFCFDGGSPPNGLADWGAPDSVVTYYINATGPVPELIRLDETSGAAFTVARYATGLGLVELGGGAQVQLTLHYRNLSQTYNLVTIDP